jgi:hypothetical protein
MKYILTNNNNEVFGPYSDIQKVDNGYMCDNDSIQTTVTGEVVVSEVEDNYINPIVEINRKALEQKPLTLEDLQAQIDALKQGA